MSFMTLNDRIQKRLQKLHKSERSVSLEAGLSDSFLRNIRSGKSVNPRSDTLEKVAAVLKTSTNWLLHGEEPETIDDYDVDHFVFSRKIPLYSQKGGGVYDEFKLEKSINLDIWCPLPLMYKKGAYAVTIAGKTMSPRYERGEYIVMDPTKCIKKGDYVLAKIQNDAEQWGPDVYVKRFISFDFNELILEQLNPWQRLYFSHKQVLAIHHIILAGSLG